MLLYAFFFATNSRNTKGKYGLFKNRANTKHTKALLAANLKLLLYEEITA
jgi:hypothetical protein